MPFRFIEGIKVQRLSLVLNINSTPVLCVNLRVFIFISKNSWNITVVTEESSLDCRLLHQELGKQNGKGRSHVSHLRQLFHYSRKKEHNRTNCQSMSSISVLFKIKNLAIKTEYISRLLKCSHIDQDKKVSQCSKTINVYIN